MALLVAAIAAFAWRGPARALVMGDDLAVYYTCARAWLHGENPYDPAVLTAHGQAAGGVPPGLLKNALNPPGTFVLMAPLALLSWPAARAAWLGVNLLSLAMALWGLLRLAPPEMTRGRRILLAALAVGLAPAASGVALGQIILPVAALVVWGLLARQAGWTLSAGALLALATAIKPQVGIFYLGYQLLRGRWRLAAAGAVVVAGLMGAGVLRMELAHLAWLPAMRANYEAFFAGGGGDLAGPMRYQFLHLSYPLFVLLGSRAAAGAIAWAVTAALAAVLLWRLRGARGDRHELAACGLVGVLSLLPVYHRSYDAIILAIPLAWAMSRPGARASLLLILPFLVPGPAILFWLGQSGRLPEWVVGAWWWQGIVLAHQAWLVLALGVAMTVEMARSSRGGGPSPAAG